MISSDLPRYRLHYFIGDKKVFEYHNDKWLKAQFRRIRVRAKRLEIIMGYESVYLAAESKEPVEQEKMVAASRAANIWLRGQMENGVWEKPFNKS